MAAASVVHNTGLQPQDGYRQPIRIKEYENPVSFSYRRKFTHYIDNSPELECKYTAGDPNTLLGYYFEDGFYEIPYLAIRAAMRPPWLEEIMHKYDAVRVKKVGFVIQAANVFEQQAKRWGDEITIQSVDANVPEFHTIHCGPWLNARTHAQQGEHVFDVNDKMKVEVPLTYEGGKLKTMRWGLGGQQLNMMKLKGFLNSIDGKSNPPFCIEQMADVRVGTPVGFSGSYTFPGQKFCATCTYDVDNRGMRNQHRHPNAYMFPNSLANYQDVWARFYMDQLSPQTWKSDIPVRYGIRLDRPRTLGGDLYRTAKLDIEYYVEMEGIPSMNWGYYSTHDNRGYIYADPWTATYRRMWSPMTEHRLCYYNRWLDLTGTEYVGQSTLPRAADDPVDDEKNKQDENNQTLLRAVQEYCRLNNCSMEEFENRFQHTSLHKNNDRSTLVKDVDGRRMITE